jgi:GT2 family glycosyltransferase
MTCQLCVSIINYRTGDMTIDCLASVLADIGPLNVQVVVVDNASGDGSAEKIAGWIATLPTGTPVRLLRSAVNSGFSGGHNQSMAAVRARYYLILNSDALLRPGFLRTILDAAEAHSWAGMVTPRIETAEGEQQVSCFRFHSPASELIRGAGSGPVTRLFPRHVVPLDPPVDPARIEWASFACILLRGEMVRAIGPMDEGYFLYFEDTEYCLRARRAGWRIHPEPAAAAIHYKGGSGPVESLGEQRKRLPAYFYSSRTRFFRQAHGPAGPVAANLMWLLGRGLAWLRLVFGKPVPRAIDHEARDIWINVRTPLGPRHAPGE